MFNFSNQQIYRVPSSQNKEFLSVLTALTSNFPPTPDNQNKVFIVFLSSVEERNAQIEFLKKILAAVQLDFDKDVVACNITSPQDFGFAKIYELYHPRHFLCFGMEGSQLGFQAEIPPYSPAHIRKTNILLANDLKTIESDSSKKKLLWNALQQIFKPK